ncbi:MAG: aspartate/glutamate racemase family protein [Candidatus Nitrosocaldaceae archaeon]
MDNRSIAIFDSGVGSISLIRVLSNRLRENIIYLADRKHHPYGLKDISMLENIISNTIDYLLRYDPKLVIVASITPTLTVLDRIRINYPIPIFGIYIPLQKAVSVGEKITIIGTRTLINSKRLDEMIKENITRVIFKKIDVSHIVKKIEENVNDIEKDIKALKIDTPLAILASTHLSLIKDKFQSVYNHTKFIDGIDDSVEQVISYLSNRDMFAEYSKPSLKILVSKDIKSFINIAKLYLTIDAEFEEITLPF